MKKTTKTISVLLATLFCFTFLFACGKNENPWETARYTKDTTLGDGSKTIQVEVEALDRSVTFTIKTDEKTVGAALAKLDLVAGEESEYGLYIKRVNGMLADVNKNNHYWAFYINEKMAMTGADSTEISENETYKFVYTK